MKNPNIFFLLLLPMALLGSCNGVPNLETSVSVGQENDTTNLISATLQTALPTTIGGVDQSGATPPPTILSPVFDFSRTEDNPITDAQQIIVILESLESIQRSQPIPSGWYLRTRNDLNDPESSEHFYNLFHVIGENLDCDLAMQFELTPEENILWRMARNYGTPIHTIPGSQVTLDEGTQDESICDSPNSPYSFFNDYSDSFSNKYYYSLNEDAVDRAGDYSFAAWFEMNENAPLFFLQEKTANIQSGYITDPDSNGWVGLNSEENIKTYSIDTGLLLRSESIMSLANNKTINHIYSTQRDYYQEMDDLPTLVLDYLIEALRKYDELQIP